MVATCYFGPDCRLCTLATDSEIRSSINNNYRKIIKYKIVVQDDYGFTLENKLCSWTRVNLWWVQAKIHLRNCKIYIVRFLLNLSHHSISRSRKFRITAWKRKESITRIYHTRFRFSKIAFDVNGTNRAKAYANNNGKHSSTNGRLRSFVDDRKVMNADIPCKIHTFSTFAPYII